MMILIQNQPMTKSVIKLYALLMVLLIALLTAVLIAPDAAMAQEAETITFPSRSSELADDSYWTVREFSEGCCKMDFNVRRWDGNSWKGGSGSSNEQDYDWNLPMYAPVSGVIASCWRNLPNDEDPDESKNPIFLAGNHVIIITDQGNAIALAHFNPGTIPAELCPSNSGNTQYPSTLDTQGGSWRVAAYIDPADRPRVTEGDYIGRIGNSGNSSGPHLHIDQTRITGTDARGREVRSSAIPMRFRYAWGHRFEATQQHTPDGWFRLRGGEFSSSDGFTMVHPSPYLRRGSAAAGAVRDVDTVFLSANRAVTALVDSDRNLKLISWDLVGLDNIIRKAEISAGAVKDVQIVEPLGNHVLVAVRGQDDELKMIAYRVAFNGSFSRVADSTAGKISALAMTATNGSDRKAVTAVREEQSGNLKLIAWDVQVANNGTTSIVRLGDTSVGSVSAISVAPARNFNGVFTAVRDSDNNLKVIPWRLSNNGNTITRGADASAGRVGNQIAIAPLAQGVAAAVQDSEGKLRIITWSVSQSGDVGARRETAIAGNVSEISLLGAPLAGSNLTTVVRNASGSLLLIGWAINDNGTSLRRVGSSLAGAATNISADSVLRSYPGKDPRDMILTALRDGENNLKIVTWDTNLNNP
jgi:hypothetical protein